jgi:hypothetical protein
MKEYFHYIIYCWGIYIYIYICCAFVVLDNKLYKMHGAYIKIHQNTVIHLWMFTCSFNIGMAKSPTRYYFKVPFLIGTEIFCVTVYPWCIHSWYYHPLNHHSVSCTNLRQASSFNACTEAVTCLSVFHQQRYSQDNQRHFVKQTSHFAHVLTERLLPRFSSSHRVSSKFQYTKIYQLWNRELQDVREGITAANTST